MSKPKNIKITLESLDELNYRCTNERGQSIYISGNKKSVAPMETVLMAVAGCSTIDIELFLKKMRNPPSRIEVEVEGYRVDAVPAVFEKIHLHYKIYGSVKDSKAKKAVELSMEKYCSVSIMLSAGVEITHSYEVIQYQDEN